MVENAEKWVVTVTNNGQQPATLLRNTLEVKSIGVMAPVGSEKAIIYRGLVATSCEE